MDEIDGALFSVIVVVVVVETGTGAGAGATAACLEERGGIARTFDVLLFVSS